MGVKSVPIPAMNMPSIGEMYAKPKPTLMCVEVFLDAMTSAMSPASGAPRAHLARAAIGPKSGAVTNPATQFAATPPLKPRLTLKCSR